MADTRTARDQLAQTGPGTPMGDRLRRSWHPVALAADLTDEHPILPVRLLAEALVLYRRQDGAVGLMQDRCTHHGYLMTLGHVEADRIVCGRHGWTFDLAGNCSILAPGGTVYPMQWAKARAYPVVQHTGLYWTYLGPAPVPSFPAELSDGRDHQVLLYRITERNWLETLDDEALRDALSPDHPLPNRALVTTLAAGELQVRVPLDDSHTWLLTIQRV